MERFLQDVLQHHPYNYQDSRLAQCEMPTNTTPPEVIRLDEFSPEDAEAEQISSKSSESVEQLSARPGVSQNSTKEVSVRPSVIQKLEKGQQQSLEFNKIESCVRKINLVGVGQATNSGKSVIRLPVICNAPARCVPESSQARPVIASTSRAPVAACLESVSKCNPSKDDRYTKELDEVPRNCMPSCHPEVSSGSYENPKDSNSKSVCVNLDTLIYQKDVECQGEALSPACKFREPKDMKSSVGVESSSKVAVKSVGKLNKPDVPPAKLISEGAIPKRHGELLLHEGCTQEEKHLVCNKPGVLKQKCSVSATEKLDCSSLQSVSVPARKAVRELHLWKDDDHEDENCGSRVIQQPQSLQEECASLKMKSSDPRPTTSFDSSEPRQSIRGKLKKTVQEMNVKEGHIYLEDKSYKLVGFEASCDSDIPIQIVFDPSHASAKEINVQKDHNDLESESYTARCSEVKRGTGIQLQSEVDPLQMAWEETSFQNRELFDVEGHASESSDSEMMYDSDVSFQIIVTQPQSSDEEADSPEVVVVNVVAGDCDRDCEVISDPEISLQLVTDPPQLTFEGISDPDIPLQLVTDPPQLTIEGISDPEIPLQLVTDPPQLIIEETSSVNAVSVEVIKSNCTSCGSHVRRKASSQPVTDQFKKTFKIINRESDYIILGDSTCQSCGCEVDFNSASDQSVTYQSQGPGHEYFHSEDKSYESDGPEGNFSFEGTSQETDTEVNVWKDPKYTGLKDKSWESRDSAMDSAAFSKSVIHHTADRENLLMRKHADPAHKSGISYGSQIDFQGDPSTQADIEKPRDVEKKTRPRKRVTFDPKEYHYFPSNYVCVVDSVKSLDEAPEVIEDPDEPVLEVLPFVSPSVSEETCPQKMRGDNIKTNCHVKKFKKDHYHSYSLSNRTTREVSLNEETEPACLDSIQNTISVQTFPDSGHVAGGAADTNDISVILDKSCCHCPLAVELLKQNWHLASPSQALKVNHATQTNKYPLKKRKIIGQAEESPQRKCLQNDRKGNKKVQVVTVEVPTSSAKALEPEQPSSSVGVLSSADRKRKEGKSSRSPKRKQSSCGKQLQSTSKSKQNNRNDPLRKKMARNPPPNPVVPGSDKSESVDTRRNGSEGSSSAGGNSAPTQNLAPKSFITTARYKLQSRVGSDEACVFLESIDNVPTGVAFKDSDFQPTPSNHGDAKVSLKPVTNECFENKSKKKVPIRKPTTSIKPRFPRSIFKAVIPQQKTGLTSEKQSVWIWTKANAIIRKYTLKYSVFLRHRYQSRASFFAVNPKKKIHDGIRLKKGRDPGKVLLNSSVPPAYFQERFRAVAGPSRKQLVLRSSSAVGRKELDDKTYTYKKKTPILVKAYNLRSSRYIPADSRMTTRLSSKQ